jgi:hypothetical protein
MNADWVEPASKFMFSEFPSLDILAGGGEGRLCMVDSSRQEQCISNNAPDLNSLGSYILRDSGKESVGPNPVSKN